MKVKIYGMCFLLGALIAGGGIDIGSSLQAVAGAILTFLAGGLLIVETNKKEYQKSNKHTADNTHPYPSYLRK